VKETWEREREKSTNLWRRKTRENEMKAESSQTNTIYLMWRRSSGSNK